MVGCVRERVREWPLKRASQGVATKARSEGGWHRGRAGEGEWLTMHMSNGVEEMHTEYVKLEERFVLKVRWDKKRNRREGKSDAAYL